MKPKLKPIDQQVVVLVGGASGIGLESAMHLVEKGAHVVLVGADQEELNSARERVRAHAEASRMTSLYNGAPVDAHTDVESDPALASPAAMLAEEQVMALQGDITNYEQMRLVADQVVQRFGRIDTWVNVADVSQFGLFENTSPEAFRRIIDVNLVGHAYAAMAALPHLRQRRGAALIFVSSTAGRVPAPYQSAYSASKHGLLGLIDSLRQELKHTDSPVSVTAVLPAPPNSSLFGMNRAAAGMQSNEDAPHQDMEMVARAIVYAASHPVRELIVGDAGYMMTFMHRLAPTLSANMAAASNFRAQRMGAPAVAGQMGEFGHTDEETGRGMMRVHPLTYLSTHPNARRAIAGGLLTLAAGLVGMRILKVRAERRSWRYRLPRQANKTFQQARVAGGKALQSAGSAIAASQVVSNLPMFQQRSAALRVTQLLAGWASAVLALLPFRRRISMGRRIINRLPDVRVGREQIRRAGSKLSQIEQAGGQRAKDLGKKATKVSEKARESVADRSKEAAKVIEKVVSVSREK